MITRHLGHPGTRGGLDALTDLAYAAASDNLADDAIQKRSKSIATPTVTSRMNF